MVLLVRASVRTGNSWLYSGAGLQDGNAVRCAVRGWRCRAALPGLWDGGRRPCCRRLRCPAAAARLVLPAAFAASGRNAVKALRVALALVSV